MKTFIFLVISVVAQAVGNTCLSKGMKNIAASSPGFDALSPDLVVYALGSPLIWVGTVCLIVFFGCYAALLSWADLSFVLPVSSVGYILNVAFAGYFLGEPVSATRWAGTLLIVLGVALVSRTAAGKPPSGFEARVATDSMDS